MALPASAHAYVGWTTINPFKIKGLPIAATVRDPTELAGWRPRLGRTSQERGMERQGFDFTIEQHGSLWTWTARAPHTPAPEAGVARSRRQAAACVIRALVRAETGERASSDAPRAA